VRLANDSEESVRLKVWHGLRVRGFTLEEAEAMTGITQEDRVRATYEEHGGTWGDHPSHTGGEAVEETDEETGDATGEETGE
jgi:hypothetical protein